MAHIEAIGRSKGKVMKLDGKVLGIPYDFHPATLRKFRQRWWNAEDPRIIVPKAFGLGYDINLYQLKRRQPVLFNLFLAGLAAVAISRLIGSNDNRDETKDDQNNK